MVGTGFDEKLIGRRNPNSNFLFSQKSSWPDLDRACMIEIRDPANISMLDPIERVALGMVGSSSNSPPLQVQEFQDEEGRIETMTDDQMYLMLGLGDEDERAKMAAPANATQEGDAHVSSVEGGASQANVVLGDSVGEVMEGAAIPVDDLVPLERMIMYDKDKPQIKLGSMFPSMNEFRLACSLPFACRSHS